MSNVLPYRASRPWAPPSSGLARRQNMIREEMEHFNNKVRQAEDKLKWAFSSLLTDCGCDTPEKQAIALERIRDDIIALVGDRWADLRRRLDDAGVDPGPRKFPTNEPEDQPA